MKIVISETLCKSLRAVFLSFIFILLFQESALSASFAHRYAITYNGQRVGTLIREVLPNQQNGLTIVRLTLTLSSLSLPIPKARELGAHYYNSGDLPLPEALQNLHNAGKPTSHNTEETETVINLVYDQYIMPPAPYQIEIETAESAKWSLQLKKRADRAILSGDTSGQTVFQNTGEGTIEEMSNANVPEGATPGSNHLEFVTAATAQIQLDPTGDHKIILFGPLLESLISGLTQANPANRSTKILTIYNPFSLCPFSYQVKRNTHRGFYLGGFCQQLTYNPDLNQILQADSPLDPHPCHTETLYQLNSQDVITAITITDSHNGFDLTFSAEEVDEETASAKHNPDKDDTSGIEENHPSNDPDNSDDSDYSSDRENNAAWTVDRATIDAEPNLPWQKENIPLGHILRSLLPFEKLW